MCAFLPLRATKIEPCSQPRVIHMNGRGYDYNLGRFLSVDPFIVEHGNSQALNPYSYVLNNPLSATDPTGYKKEDTATKDVTVRQTGSRIERKVTVTLTETTNDDGTTTVTRELSGGTHSDRQAVSNGITNHFKALGGNSVTGTTSGGGIGGQQERSNVTSGAVGSGPDWWTGYEIPDEYRENQLLAQDSNTYNDFAISNIANFIRDEGASVLMRTGQAVGGAGQVLLGGGMYYSTGGLACAAGSAIAIKGIDNFQSGIRGEDSFALQFFTNVTGSKVTGNLINFGLDLSTSVYGVLRPVPKINEYGNPMKYLMHRDPKVLEPAYNQATTTGLIVEGLTSGAGVYGTLRERVAACDL